MSEFRPNPIDGRRILIVEDGYFIARDMEVAFQGNGAEVIGPAANVDEALDLIEEAGTSMLLCLMAISRARWSTRLPMPCWREASHSLSQRVTTHQLFPRGSAV